MIKYEKELSAYIVNQLYDLFNKLCKDDYIIPKYRIICIFINGNTTERNQYEFENFQYINCTEVENLSRDNDDDMKGKSILDDFEQKYEYEFYNCIDEYSLGVMFETQHIPYETNFFNYILSTYFKTKKTAIENLLKTSEEYKKSSIFVDFLNRSIFRALNCGYETESIISQAVTGFFYYCYGIDINLITTLSCETYEGIDNVCGIYIPRKYVGRGKRSNELTIKLNKKLDFNFHEIRRIRKYMEISKGELNIVLDSNKRVIGYTNKKAKKYEGEIEIDGKLNWTFYLGHLRLIYNAGVYRIISNMEVELRIDFDYIPFALPKRQTERIFNIICESKKQTHGTTIVFGETEQIKKETMRLAYYNRCIQISPINLVKNMGILLNLTSIDGAVLVDFNGQCYAIGVIFDGDMATKGNMERGARYNSTVNYIERQKQKGYDFLAVVVSEDKTIDIYPYSRTEDSK